MSSSDEFAELMSRVQGGDPEAADELIRRYEPDIRTEVRVRLRVQDSRLKRILDSTDITQSVLASFFTGVAAGRLAPKHPQQLVGLLVAMARNKLLSRVRDQRRQRRDLRRAQSLDPNAHDVSSPGETPSQVVSGKELLGEFRRRLSDDERRVADRRAAGQPWGAIAAELGGTPEARRKQLERAFARVAQELGLDDPDTAAADRPQTPAGGAVRVV